MDIELEKVSILDCQEILNMQIITFKELLDICQDFSTNPGAESLDKIVKRME